MSANEKERGPDEIQEEPSTPVTTEKKKREYKDFGHDEEKATRMCLFLLNAIALLTVIQMPRSTCLPCVDP